MDDIRQLLIAPGDLWDDLDDWLRRRGLYLAGPIPPGSDGIPTYIIGISPGLHDDNVPEPCLLHGWRIEHPGCTLKYPNKLSDDGSTSAPEGD